ncbi:virion structural protein [Shigella phage vB_SflS-ISF001]|uniref:Uncharacterized protein n=1 Tax=Shigella phage vB_SflS-ISF001 TaxID=2048005 RepID=A0A2D1GQ99_9CAUD|nr:virion structural protein [Shigella phage vB_SflS-ISF001]ATN94111.1 hypothetical protein FLXISF001_033 [Shigella phage vB_SflS-ISF001]
MDQETLNKVVEQMRKQVPALRKVPDETLYAWVEMAELYVCQKTFKAAYVKALAHYALPLAFLDGALKGEDKDPESYSRLVTSFSLSGKFSHISGEVTKNQSENKMLSTPWGKMFEQLKARHRGRFALMTGLRGGCHQ